MNMIPVTSCEIYNWRPLIPVVVTSMHRDKWVPEDRTPGRSELDEAAVAAIDRRTDSMVLAATRLGAAGYVARLTRVLEEPAPAVAAGKQKKARTTGSASATTSPWAKSQEQAAARADRWNGMFRWTHDYRSPLHQLVGEIRDWCGVCVVIDLRRYATKPLPYKWDQDRPRPEVQAGTHHFHTPAWLTRLVGDKCDMLGLSHTLFSMDGLWPGAYVPLGSRLGDAAVSSVVLQIRQDVYLDETPTPAAFGEARGLGLLLAVVAEAGRSARERAEPRLI
jgi:N-formylglutamate deformylase